MVAGYPTRILAWGTLWAKTTPLFLVQPSLCEWKREERESEGESRRRRREMERGEREIGEGR